MTETNKIFIDSNIWLYRLLVDPTTNQAEHNQKRQIAITLTQASNQNIIVSTQVITETCSVLKRKTQLSEEQILELITEFEEQCEVINLTTIEMKYACQLRSDYNFSYWDSLIIASALNAGAKTFYSEDMQHNLLITNQLIIINPFL
jgi:predicted nucleic acid-binding protein